MLTAGLKRKLATVKDKEADFSKVSPTPNRSDKGHTRTTYKIGGNFIIRIIGQ